MNAHVVAGLAVLLVNAELLRRSSRGRLGPVVVLPVVAASLLYVSLPLAEQAVLGLLPVRGSVLQSAEMSRMLALQLSSLLVVGVSMPMLTLGIGGHSAELLLRGSDNDIRVLGTVGVLLLLYSIGFDLSRVSGYLENQAAGFSNPGLAVGKMLTASAAGIMAWRRWRGRQFAGCFAYSSVPVLLAFVTADKNPLLPLAGAAVLGEGARIFSVGRLRLVLVLAVGSVGLVTALRVFSFYRAGLPVLTIVSVARDRGLSNVVSITAGDPGGAYESLAEAAGGSLPGGVTLSVPERMLALLPRALAPDRPVTPGIRYARARMQAWNPGQGRGFHMLADGIASFGWLPTAFLTAAVSLFALILLLAFISVAPQSTHAVAVVGVFASLMLSFRAGFEGGPKWIVGFLVTLWILRSGLSLARISASSLLPLGENQSRSVDA